MGLLCLALLCISAWGTAAEHNANLCNNTYLLSLGLAPDIPIDSTAGLANYTLPKTVMDFIPTQCGANNTCPPMNIRKLYLEMGCVPSKKLSKFCCPDNYDCASVFAKRSKTQCQYKGKLYKVGAKLTVEGLPCYTDIVCAVKNKVTGFTFTKTKCPAVKPKANTMQLYSFTKCCSTGSRSTVLTDKEFKCNYDNLSYPVGAQIPSPTPCEICICHKGFDGTLRSPWCQIRSCGYELDAHNNIFKGLAPLIGLGSCCPYRWQAPTTADMLLPNPVKAPDATGACAFGTQKIKFGDGLVTAMTKSCALCGCWIGPMLQCGWLSDCNAAFATLVSNGSQ